MPKDIISRDSSTGRQKVVKAITTSAGSADVGKLIELDATGKVDKTALPTVTSGGTASQSGKLPELNASGKLHLSFLPDGVAVESIIAVAAEALAANDIVSLDNTGKVVKAVSTNVGKAAVGYVKVAVASAANAEVFFGNINSGYTGLTPGADVYLSSTAGLPKSTVPVAGTDTFAQVIGTAISATTILFEIGSSIIEL